MGQPEGSSSASDGIWGRAGRSGCAAVAVMLAIAVGACGRTELDPDPGADAGDGGHAGVGGTAGIQGGAGGGSAGHGGQAGTGGAIGTGGTRGSGGAIGAGGIRGSGGAIGVGGAPGIGGARAGVGGSNVIGILIPITGALTDLVIDAADSHVYVTNSDLNRIEDVLLASSTLQTPIDDPSGQPAGLDLTADGKTLYVANNAIPSISVVDLASRQQSRRIDIPPYSLLSVAIAANGQALFCTPRMETLDIATDAVSDVFVNGNSATATMLRASRDRSVIAALAGGTSLSAVYLYRSSTNLLSLPFYLNTSVTNVAVNRDGSVVLIDGSYVLDQSPKLLGIIPTAARGAAFASSSGPLAYRALLGNIETVDTSQFKTISFKPLPDTMTNLRGGSNIGRMVVTSDGTRAAVITDHGLSLVTLP